jgi:hypothetical protein
LAEGLVEQGGFMSDTAATPDDGSNTPMTIADVLRGVEPMGDLRQFAIDDLTPDDEDEFFRILEGA